jgi:hypothetical protein
MVTKLGEGTAVGNVAYWNGTEWVLLTPPASRKFLKQAAAEAPAWDTLQSSDVPLNIKQVEVDFGDGIQDEAVFTVVDAGVVVTSQILAQLAREAPTNKDQDETEMDSFNVICTPANGQFEMFMKSLEGSVYGKFKVKYLIA